MKFSISKRIYIITAIALAGTILVTGLSLLSGQSLVSKSRRLGQFNLSSVAALFEINRLVEAQNNVVSRAPAQLDLKVLAEIGRTYSNNIVETDRLFDRLNEIDVTGVYRDKITAIKTELRTSREISAQVFKLSSEFQQADAVTLLQEKGYKLQDLVRSKLAEVSNDALRAAQAQPDEIIKAAEGGNRLVVIVCLSLFGLAATLVVWLTRTSVISPIIRVADKLSATFEETNRGVDTLGESGKSVAESASGQAATLEETGASLEELAVMTKQNADNAQRTNELMVQAREAAEAGVKEVQGMNAAMQAIQKSSSEISQIIKTIDEISFQTNILALNAAVEAARAGDAGLGFAVVADEVRSLAQRSASAAHETASKIEAAIERTKQGVDITRQVAAALEQITNKVREVSTLSSEVAEASKQQREGIEQMTVSVAQVDKLTQSTAANAEDSVTAVNHLKEQANALKNSVAELLELVEGVVKTRPAGKRVSNVAVEVQSPGRSRTGGVTRSSQKQLR